MLWDPEVVWLNQIRVATCEAEAEEGWITRGNEYHAKRSALYPDDSGELSNIVKHGYEGVTMVVSMTQKYSEQWRKEEEIYRETIIVEKTNKCLNFNNGYYN